MISIPYGTPVSQTLSSLDCNNASELVCCCSWLKDDEVGTRAKVEEDVGLNMEEDVGLKIEEEDVGAVDILNMEEDEDASSRAKVEEEVFELRLK